MNTNNYSFAENIAREFGRGVKPRNLAAEERNVSQKKETMMNWKDRLSRDSAKFKANPQSKFLEKEMNEAHDGYMFAKKEYEDAKEALFSGDVFGQNAPSNTLGLIPCEGEINLADLYNARFETEGKTSRVVVERYNDTTLSAVVGEGESIPENDIRNHIISISTDREDIKKIAGILNVPETMLSDERELLNGAIDSVQAKHTGNTETMLLCKAIQSSKEAVEISPITLGSIVNGSLCGKAKRNCEIITNESGFSKLDIKDEFGNAFIKKDFNLGEYVFDDKYIVRTLSDEMLPNNADDSAPVFVGDWKNVLRLAVVKEYPPLEELDLYNCVIKNRAIKKTIPILTTTSDKAFIVGYIGE